MSIMFTLATLWALLFTGGHIEEDSPFWDCTTMGNRVCGEAVK